LSTLPPSVRRVLLGLFLCVASLPCPAASADGEQATAVAPQISKIEPPGWWAGHTVNPVRVLLHGAHLRGATVTAEGRGITVGPPRVSARGTYLFMDVTISPTAAPGPRTLRVRTPAGTAAAAFTVEKPLLRAGRFQGFTPDDVIYLILPDRFCDGDPGNNDPPKSRGLYDPTKTRSYHGGDFAGIRKKLSYLKDLGVTALWLTPVYDNADVSDPARVYDGQRNIDYHGYGATDLYGVEEHFGTLAELKALVNAAHALGIKVIQDQVANHAGPFHPWANDPPTPNWLNGTREKHLACDWQVWNLMNSRAAPATQRATLDGWFADILPDLNQDDPEMARYWVQNSLWWVGSCGFDAIRQDTLPYAPHRFWRRWTAALKRQYPHLNILGEVNEADPALVAFFQGGRVRFDGIDTGVDTLFD
jgi:hypothetical protein